MSGPHVRRPIWIVIALVAVASVVIAFLLTRQDDPEPLPQPQPTAAPTPKSGTLLVQLRDDSGQAVVNVLLGGEPTGHTGSELYLPSGLLVPTPTVMRLRRTTDSNDTLAARNGVATLLRVRVDATLSLDRLALAGIVDAVDGVQVSAGAGQRRLSGVQAAQYALSDPADDTPGAIPLNARTVLEQVLKGLPESTERMRQTVVSLGSLARSSATNDELVPLLQQMRADALSNATVRAVLPVTRVGAGAGAATVPDQPGADQVLTRLFPDSRLTTGETPLPRLILRPAGASVSQLLTARRVLTAAGIAVIDGAPAPAGFTEVRVDAGIPASTKLGDQVVTSLGLRPEAIRASDEHPVDAVVLLGSDSAAHLT